ncbi:hypothetical protein P691DRAFT_682753 [Macrolepiota fuliginosa MF-IS2]|uniref:Uncharacterized protein n=1 Tax=Macrolepiota fuliginosa MF-IS2 TaxID=1400762 RepID=A0A9P5X1V8_9AGAR|nr:hypothetical protein P691DRAFT_682753 [Macrolepiota fuliginosa MF-IS2]
MYRFADYADIPELKSLAKEGIRKNLTKVNVVTELFSSFTSKYQEIIELEVEFLVDNFTYEVARELDEMLQLVVMGTKPHCFRVLTFTMRRLRGECVETAWSALGNDTLERGTISPPVPPTPGPCFPDSEPGPKDFPPPPRGGSFGPEELGGWGLGTWRVGSGGVEAPANGVNSPSGPSTGASRVEELEDWYGPIKKVARKKKISKPAIGPSD